MASKPSISVGSTWDGDTRPFERGLRAACLKLQDWERGTRGFAFFFLFPLGRRAYVEVPRGK